MYQYITQEYARACLITYASYPKNGYQEGWGLPGTNRIVFDAKSSTTSRLFQVHNMTASNSEDLCWIPSRSSVRHSLRDSPARKIFPLSFLTPSSVLGQSVGSCDLRLDKLAHQVIPRHPELRPHARMLHHFRFILPLLPKDEDGLTPLHYYDSGIQLARNSGVEPTEMEYIRCMAAAYEIKSV